MTNEILELERLDLEATPGPWWSLRDGNQYVRCRHGTQELVGASRLEGVERPWNPYGTTSTLANDPDVVRFKDEDADLVAAMRRALPRLLAVARAAERVLVHGPSSETPAAYARAAASKETHDELRAALAALGVP